ncbi:hypothetical protein KSS87_003557 [Heliosperma pusillum]|nr:hypothetical protein KSS87_003557 [Heliosperma pusillum]
MNLVSRSFQFEVLEDQGLVVVFTCTKSNQTSVPSFSILFNF